MSTVLLPSHAYVPGQNERHSEDAFDVLRNTAVPGQTSDELACCDAFVAGLHYLHAGFYWEAHEVLEPVWMALAIDSDERRFVQCLIQLANGRLKLKMERPRAALRLVGQARGLIPTDDTNMARLFMAVKVQDAHDWIDSLESDILSAL